MQRTTCPSCGYLVFESDPTDEICPICYWQFDPVDNLLGSTVAEPNRVSLLEAQRNYEAFGASEPRLAPFVRAPDSSIVRDPAWRPIDSTGRVTASRT